LKERVGWASPTKHHELAHITYFLAGDAHPTTMARHALPLQFYKMYSAIPFIRFFAICAKKNFMLSWVLNVFLRYAAIVLTTVTIAPCNFSDAIFTF